MAKTRRDILREKRDKQAQQRKSKTTNAKPKDTSTSIGFMKGGMIGAVVGFAVGVAIKQKAFCTVAGFLTGGYIAENVKRMKENETTTNVKFVNFKAQGNGYFK